MGCQEMVDFIRLPTARGKELRAVRIWRKWIRPYINKKIIHKSHHRFVTLRASERFMQITVIPTQNEIDSTTAPTKAVDNSASTTKEPKLDSNSQQNGAIEKVTLSSKAVSLSKADSDLNSTVTLTPKEESARLKKILSSLGRYNDQEVATTDKEIPDSSDPERLAQAKQATAAIYNKGPNPFENLSRDALSNIAYDDSGKYTKNERNAALNRRGELDENFFQPIFAQGQATGDWREADTASLAFYNQLSPLEKSQYPAGYELQMKSRITTDNTEQGGPLSKTFLDELGKKYTALRNESSNNNDAGDQSAATKTWSETLKNLALSKD